jgi:hypothetical protein
MKLDEIELREREQAYNKKRIIDEIESDLMKNKVIKERIEILKDLGVSQKELQIYATGPLSEGMLILDSFKMNGIIDQQKYNSDSDNVN